MLRQKLAETAEPYLYAAALKASSDPPSLQKAAAKFITREWLQAHHLEGVPEQAILALVALSGKIHCDAAEEKATAASVQPLWATLAAGKGADDPEADFHY